MVTLQERTFYAGGGDLFRPLQRWFRSPFSPSRQHKPTPLAPPTPPPQEGDFVVMVQEYAGGGDLFRLLQKYGGRLSERQAVALVLDPFLRALQVWLEGVRAAARQPGGGKSTHAAPRWQAWWCRLPRARNVPPSALQPPLPVPALHGHRTPRHQARWVGCVGGRPGGSLARLIVLVMANVSGCVCVVHQLPLAAATKLDAARRHPRSPRT